LGARGCRRIPGRGHRDGHREDSAEAVDDVEAEDERDVQARFLDGQVLEAVDFSGIGDEEKRSQLTIRNGVVDGFLFAEIEELAELADFFFQGHLFEKQVGVLAYCRVIGRSSGGSLTERERSDGEREEKDQALLERFLIEPELPVLIQFNLL